MFASILGFTLTIIGSQASAQPMIAQRTPLAVSFESGEAIVRVESPDHRISFEGCRVANDGRLDTLNLTEATCIPLADASYDLRWGKRAALLDLAFNTVLTRVRTNHVVRQLAMSTIAGWAGGYFLVRPARGLIWRPTMLVAGGASVVGAAYGAIRTLSHGARVGAAERALLSLSTGSAWDDARLASLRPVEFSIFHAALIQAIDETKLIRD